MSMTSYTPSELIMARTEAFVSGDFGFIYDSYHPESNFRRQFPDRGEYCRYGVESLSPDYKIIDCRVLDEDCGDGESRVLFLMRMHVQGTSLQFAELAWLKKEGQAWRYHRSQKMTSSELPAEPETLSFRDFSGLDPDTIY